MPRLMSNWDNVLKSVLQQCVYRDYDLTAWILGGIEKFDCELYIPDVEKLQMDGDTILLHEHVIKKLDEIYNMKKLEEAKMKQDAKKEQ